jgi:membrane-associated phospholipid phosphatase
MRALVACGAVALAVSCSSQARAQAPRVHQLRYDVALDATVIGVSAVFLVTSELVPGIKPLRCRWCDRSDDGDTLNPIDRGVRGGLRWSQSRVPAFASNLNLLVVEPTALLVELGVASSEDNARRAFPVDVLLVSEAAAVSMFFNQAAKLAFARERPFVHAMTPEEREKEIDPDNDVSFYSGHAALGFSLAAASGTVASLRGYRLAPLVWSTLLPLAALTGVLRIGADKHYLTDVLGGAVMGCAIGALVPLLFHPRRGDDRVENNATAAAPTGTVAAPLRPTSAPMVSFGGGF